MNASPRRGLGTDIVNELSWKKGEPKWMTDKRLHALRHFESQPMPDWAGDLPENFFRGISYDTGPVDASEQPEVSGAGRRYPAGVLARYESELAYERHLDDLRSKGVMFCDLHTAVGVHPELVQAFLGSVVPADVNKFSALNSSLWGVGTFIYIPPGLKVEMPLESSSRINELSLRQFERTLIVADEGSELHYIDGCSAPVYTSDPLYSAVVEVVVKESARVSYTTIQNWSNNVFNLVTKRAKVFAEGRMEWIDGNIGARCTMQYPGVVMAGPKSSGEVRSVAYAGSGQHQDVGAQMIHAAPETRSSIITRSIAKDGGRTSCRPLVHVDPRAHGSLGSVRCDALLLDDISRSDTLPSIEMEAAGAHIDHADTVSKIGDDQFFYLRTRGLTEQQAEGMIVNGFIEPVTRALPMEYAVEWHRLIELQMEGAVG